MTHCHHHLAPLSPSTQGSRQAQLPSPPHRDESPSLLLRCPQRRQTWGPAALQGAGSRGGAAGSGCGWAASSWLREFRGTCGHFPSRSHGFSALARGHGRHPRQVSSSAQAGRSPRLSLEITDASPSTLPKAGEARSSPSSRARQPRASVLRGCSRWRGARTAQAPDTPDPVGRNHTVQLTLTGAQVRPQVSPMASEVPRSVGLGPGQGELGG